MTSKENNDLNSHPFVGDVASALRRANEAGERHLVQLRYADKAEAEIAALRARLAQAEADCVTLARLNAPASRLSMECGEWDHPACPECLGWLRPWTRRYHADDCSIGAAVARAWELAEVRSDE